MLRLSVETLRRRFTSGNRGYVVCRIVDLPGVPTERVPMGPVWRNRALAQVFLAELLDIYGAAVCEFHAKQPWENVLRDNRIGVCHGTRMKDLGVEFAPEAESLARILSILAASEAGSPVPPEDYTACRDTLAAGYLKKLG